jgi:hypothetical protein
MRKKRLPLTLFWIGLIITVALATIGTWSLMGNLRTLTLEELASTIWAEGGPLFVLWALAVTLGSILAGIGALMYVKTKPVFSWLTGIGVLGAVFFMVMVWSRVYNPMLFGIGGIINLAAFFAIVWIWMKRYAGLGMPEKIAGSYKLVGYIFWINATWFMCGETAKLHLKAFEGSSAPSPIEIMVFLVLGWLFVLAGEYKAMQVRQSQVDPELAGRGKSTKGTVPQPGG